MFRFILVALIWILCVGGVAFYMHARDADRETRTAGTAVAPESAKARYKLELTLTFDAQPDPFALSTDDSQSPSVASVRINDTPAAVLTEGTAPGEPWVKEDIPGIVVGTNELFLEATPPLEDPGIRHGIRVRLLENGQTVADRTFWNEGGSKVTGTLRFEIAPKKNEDDHDH